MDTLYIAASSSSPEIDFRFNERHLSIRGEAYPENAAVFWSPILDTLRKFLIEDASDEPLIIDIFLTYFNSSSTKMLFSFFSLLDEKASKGIPVLLNWHRDEEDDTIFEFGQELQEDFCQLTFHDLPTGRA